MRHVKLTVPTLTTMLPASPSRAVPPLTGEILAHELPQALARCPTAEVLSLDCFDTLLWRDCHAPTDVFAGLPGISPLQRRWAENSARTISRFSKARAEVTIAEIYAALFPNAPADVIAAAIDAELAAEARHCFAFAPIVALMRAAKARGLRVVIVSDTYLDATQLRALIHAAAGEEVAGLIDRIFASSAYGKGKGGGLYGDVLTELGIPPAHILHIGDNHGADVLGVSPFGVNTLHLKQFSEPVIKQLRQEAGLDAMLHPAPPVHAPDAPAPMSALQPHRAALALLEPSCANPAERFGLAVLGPAMAGFEAWLRAEATVLKAARGGTVHWLFLMRDGHLPKLVHAAAGAWPDPAHAVEISRFTATAAGLTREGAAMAHALREIGTIPEALARQLLFPKPDIARLLQGRDPQAATQALLAELGKRERRRAIGRTARAFARRLVAHVRRIANPLPGDTLMLVDLGYNGTVQNHIDALLREELGVHVAGRYLLLREMEAPGLDKAGFLDARYYAPSTLEALCAHVAVIEQLATAPTGSVVDYTHAGEPIRRANDIKASQSTVREGVQAGVLGFAQAYGQAILRADTPDQATHEAACWRRGAAAALARLMYLPAPEELALFARFEHDVNLGTARTVPLFDPEVATQGLRQRGLFYLKSAERMYLPAELAHHGLATRLTLFAAKRFALPLTFSDMHEARLTLPVIVADPASDSVTATTITATPTHDGFYLAAIPVGDGRLQVAAQLGAIAEWVEVESIMVALADGFFTGAVRTITRPDGTRTSEDHQTPLTPLADGMAEVAPRLWHAPQASGFLMLRPPERFVGARLMVALVFRPIVPR